MIEPLDEKSFFVGKYEKSDQIFFDPFYGGNGIDSFGFGENGFQHPRIVLILHAVAISNRLANISPVSGLTSA